MQILYQESITALEYLTKRYDDYVNYSHRTTLNIQCLFNNASVRLSRPLIRRKVIWDAMNPKVTMVHYIAFDESDTASATFNSFKGMISICWLIPPLRDDLFLNLGQNVLYMNILYFISLCIVLAQPDFQSYIADSFNNGYDKNIECWVLRVRVL